MLRFIRIVVYLELLGLLCLYGCEMNESRQSFGRMLIIGIDWSGSYKLQQEAKDQVVEIIKKAKPGDRIMCLAITDSSYLNNSFYLKVTIPYSTYKTDLNPFDIKQKRARRQEELRIEQIKQTAIESVRSWNRKSSAQTDVNGFIAFAADLFSVTPDTMKKYLFIASDLKDNVNHEINPDLKGVRIIVFAFQHDAVPTGVEKRRHAWISFFKSHGATSVEFLPAEAKR